MESRTKMLGDPSKFEWAQLFNNENGKTSASSFAGLIVTIVGTTAFLIELYRRDTVMMEHCVTLIGIGSALLGVRKWMNTKVTPESYETGTDPDIEFVVPDSALHPDDPDEDE